MVRIHIGIIVQGQECHPHFTDRDAWLREAEGPAQATQLENGRAGHSAEAGPTSKRVPFPLSPLSLIGSCHCSLMEFNFPAGRLGGWKEAASSDLDKVLGKTWARHHALLLTAPPLPCLAVPSKCRKGQLDSLVARLALEYAHCHHTSL